VCNLCVREQRVLPAGRPFDDSGAAGDGGGTAKVDRAKSKGRKGKVAGAAQEGPTIAADAHVLVDLSAAVVRSKSGPLPEPSVSLGHLLQHLELLVPHTAIVGAAALVRRFLALQPVALDVMGACWCGGSGGSGGGGGGGSGGSGGGGDAAGELGASSPTSATPGEQALPPPRQWSPWGPEWVPGWLEAIHVDAHRAEGADRDDVPAATATVSDGAPAASDVCGDSDRRRWLQPRVRLPERPAFALCSLLRALHAVCGSAVLTAMSTLETRGPVVAFGFGTMGDGQQCRACGLWRVLRSVCVHCGADHRWAVGLHAQSVLVGGARVQWGVAPHPLGPHS
jgi:hypothetical protein